MTLVLDFFIDLFYAVIQVLMFSLIPYIWWLFTARKQMSFLFWTGLKGHSTPQKLKSILLIIAFVIIISITFTITIPHLLGNIENATAKAQCKGIGAIPSILVFSYIQTGLAEELFFRGFIGKRLIHHFGFYLGNGAQALIFGTIHSLFFIRQISLWRCLLFGVLIFVVAWVQGYFNEKLGKGTIFAGWLCHGTMNALSGIIAAFSL